MKLTIIVPAHNEENRIQRFLNSYPAYFAELYGDQVEILVVVNGSTDNTAKIIEEYCKTCPQMKLIVEPRSVGKGGAVILGFEAAKGELIGFVDADASTPPRAFQDLVDKIGDAGAIIASRWFKESIISPPQPLKRRIASRFFNQFVRLLFGFKISDTQCGAKVIRQEVIEKILPHIGITRWAFDVDLLFQVNREGYQIVEVPTEWNDVRGSKLPVVRASAEMFLAMCRLRLIYSPFSRIVPKLSEKFSKLYQR